MKTVVVLLVGKGTDDDPLRCPYPTYNMSGKVDKDGRVLISFPDADEDAQSRKDRYPSYRRTR